MSPLKSSEFSTAEDSGSPSASHAPDHPTKEDDHAPANDSARRGSARHRILLGWLADTVEAPQQETCCQPVSKQDELLSL
jgi:hypothetical protein